MRDWSLEHVSNDALVRDLQTLVAQDRVNLARLLAHLAEVQARKLYREAAQPSMHAYCVNVLHFSDDAAYKRIHVAGVARRVPELFTAIAEGRLHLSGACTIAPHLTPANAEELLAAVTHQTREQIQKLIAARAPRADLLERITPFQPTRAAAAAQVVANIEAQHAPGHVAPAERKLERVFKRALTLLVRDLERRKCAATDKPRPARRPKTPDVISASVRREVWERDQAQCTFINEEGRRCPSRGGLEVDHIQPKARAGLHGRPTAITASDVRLLCRAHNQLLAERSFGAAFMRHKRERAAAARESGAPSPPGA